MFLIGLLIVIYPHIAQIAHQSLQTKQVKDLQASWEELSEAEKNKVMEAANACNQYVSEGIHDPFSSHQGNVEAMKECLGIDNSMIAAIEIPKLDLLIPIYIGSSEEILSKGIGHVEGSSLPLGGLNTHSVLAGHRGMGTKEMFRNIDKLDAGDTFYIHTINETLAYEVYDQTIIYPNETEILEIQEGKDLVTLLTCHPYRHNYQRLLIHAKRLS